MKKMNLIYGLYLVTLVLSAWAMIQFYSFFDQFAEVVRQKKIPFYVEINVLPIILALLVCGVISFIIYKLQPRKKKKSIFTPDEFAETDEREEMITAKACRNVYAFMGPITCVVLVLMMFYPFLSDKVPYYPVLVVLFMPFAQWTVYYFSVRKQKL